MQITYFLGFFSFDSHFLIFFMHKNRHLIPKLLVLARHTRSIYSNTIHICKHFIRIDIQEWNKRQIWTYYCGEFFSSLLIFFFWCFCCKFSALLVPFYFHTVFIFHFISISCFIHLRLYLSYTLKIKIGTIIKSLGSEKKKRVRK